MNLMSRKYLLNQATYSPDNLGDVHIYLFRSFSSSLSSFRHSGAVCRKI
jgi:hypothetical protein